MQSQNHTVQAGPAVPLVRGASGGFSIFINPPCLWPDSMSGQPGAPLRVLVVDGDAHARGVIAHELMGDSRTVVAGQAGSLREGRRLVREAGFDVLLVDMELADGVGLDLIPHAKAAHASATAVVLSRHENDEDAMRSFDCGAMGFVTKSSWFVSYVQVVLQVCNGGAFVTPTVSRRLLPRLSGGTVSANDAVQVRLSARELEVLKMIAAGFTSQEIGDRLSISCTTVNSHVKHLYEKLHVHSRAQAVSCAASWGLL